MYRGYFLYVSYSKHVLVPNHIHHQIWDGVDQDQDHDHYLVLAQMEDIIIIPQKMQIKQYQPQIF